MEPNTSGQGKAAVLPEGVKGWSWGAFFWTWIWGLFNKTYISLIALIPIPIVTPPIMILLGIKGREWAWRNKKWDSLEHFNRVQRKWSLAALFVFVGVALLGILAAVLIPGVTEFLKAAKKPS